MDSKAHRAKYLEIRGANPTMRLRTDLNLGPRTVVQVQTTTRSTLKKPKEYFVELGQYMNDHPEAVVKESDKVYEQIDGKWIQGVHWYVLTSHFPLYFLGSHLIYNLFNYTIIINYDLLTYYYLFYTFYNTTTNRNKYMI